MNFFNIMRSLTRQRSRDSNDRDESEERRQNAREAEEEQQDSGEERKAEEEKKEEQDREDREDRGGRESSILEALQSSLASNRRQRIRAAFVRSLMTGRNPTQGQMNRIRRLVRLGSGNASDSDDILSQGSASSSDDLQYFEQVKDNFGEDEDDQLSSSEKLVDQRILHDKLKFNKKLPSQWAIQIIKNELDLDTANKINKDFGSIGLLLYTQLRELEFFDIDDLMIRFRHGDDSNETEPLDFIKPIVIFYLNTIRQYQQDKCIHIQEKYRNPDGEVNYLFKVNKQCCQKDSEKVEIKPDDQLGLRRKKEQEKANDKFSLYNLKQFIGVSPKITQIQKAIKYMEDKETIIYKIILDILGSYLRVFYGADSAIYTQKYLPCAIKFYEACDPQQLSAVCIVLLQRVRDSFSRSDIDECLFKRFVQDILCLPGNDGKRIEIEMNDLYKDYYINLLKSQMVKYNEAGQREANEQAVEKHKQDSNYLKLIKSKSAKTEIKAKLGSKSKMKNELKIKAKQSYDMNIIQ